MEKTTQGISRRSFIGMGAVAAMAAGAAGLAGCSPAAKTTADTATEANGQPAASDVHIHNVTDTSWMTPPGRGDRVRPRALL